MREGVDLTVVAVASTFAAGSALVIYGMSTSTEMIAYQSTLQTALPAEVGGRAFADYDVLWNGPRLDSLAGVGLLVEVAGVRAVYVAGGVLLLAAAAVGLTTALDAEAP